MYFLLWCHKPGKGHSTSVLHVITGHNDFLEILDSNNLWKGKVVITKSWEPIIKASQSVYWNAAENWQRQSL